MRRSRQQVAVGLLLAFWATEAVASKYVGPKTVEVTCVVERVVPWPDAGPVAVESIDGQPHLRFEVAPADGEQVVAARVEHIDAFDANGWRPQPELFVPKSLRVAVPLARARKGERLHVHIDYRPGYEDKAQTHVILTTRLK